MKDLTIIYISSNIIDTKKFKEQILKCVGDTEIISVTFKPTDFGTNIIYGEQEVPSARHIYRQILIGAKAAKTKYVAICEDDVLYVPEHFTLRPRDEGTIAYNVCKWSLYSWSNPAMFSFKQRCTTTSMIAPRDYLIKCIEERYALYPDDNNYPEKYWGEVGRYSNQLGVSKVYKQEMWTTIPNVVLSHEYAIGMSYLGTRKRMGMLRAMEVPYWGRAEDVLKIWQEDVGTFKENMK